MQKFESQFCALLPLLLFLTLFVGSGLYFSYQGHPFAFYQISPIIAILPAIILAFAGNRRPYGITFKDFINGVRDENIIIMCLIYLLAGAFAALTEHIGCVSATVHLTLQNIPPSWMLPGVFVIASFVATAMGTSMGTIATITPLAFTLANQTGIPSPLCVGAVIGGAMFGDNLSLVSDTTIAAVSTQKANMRAKLLLNFKFALPAAILTLAIYGYHSSNLSEFPISSPTSGILILPYLIILSLALLGLNVFVVLMGGIMSGIFIGLWATPGFSMVIASQTLLKGSASMHEIMILSLLIGGLSHVMHQQGGLEWIIKKIKDVPLGDRPANPQRSCELKLCILVSLADFCTANNTVAIILCGPIVQRLRIQAGITAERAACLIDIFSCTIQGMLPYSAQILLACSIAHLSPFDLVPYVLYCPLLGVVTFVMIYWHNYKKS